MNALFYLIKKLFRAAKWWKKWNSMPEWHEMKCCSVRLFAIRETTKIFVSLSAARSVRLRLFQNWNSLCCKCQAFITHNLFISLHIKLVMFFFVYMAIESQGCMPAQGLIAQATLFPCAQLRSPSVAAWVCLSCDRFCYRNVVLVEFPLKRNNRRSEDEEEDAGGVRRETKFNTQQLPNTSLLILFLSSCIQKCVYVCASSLIVLSIAMHPMFP